MVFTKKNERKRCSVYNKHHFRLDFVNFDDFIDNVVKCVSNFRYQTWSNDWLSSCGFTFNKAYSFAIDSHHLFSNSTVAPFFLKCPINLLRDCNHNVIVDYCTQFSQTFDHIDNIFINFLR